MTTLKMWGHSAALRIPSELMKQANFAINQAVRLRAEKGRIVVEPEARSYDIDELVAAITAENSHTFVEQPRIGAENIEW